MDTSEYRKNLMERMRILGEMASTETALFHQTAATKLGLGITDIKTMSYLTQEGAMTAGQLAKQLHLTTGAVTNVIDRLEKRGFAQRTFDAKDRRKVIVSINIEKLNMADNIYQSIGETFQKLLESYSTEEIELLVSYFEASIKLTKMETAKLHP